MIPTVCTLGGVAAAGGGEWGRREGSGGGREGRGGGGAHMETISARFGTAATLIRNKRSRFLPCLHGDADSRLPSLRGFPASVVNLLVENAGAVLRLNARIPDHNIPFSLVSSYCVWRTPPFVSAQAGHARAKRHAAKIPSARTRL